MTVLKRFRWWCIRKLAGNEMVLLNVPLLNGAFLDAVRVPDVSLDYVDGVTIRNIDGLTLAPYGQVFLWTAEQEQLLAGSVVKHIGRVH